MSLYVAQFSIVLFVQYDTTTKELVDLHFKLSLTKQNLGKILTHTLFSATKEWTFCGQYRSRSDYTERVV